MDQRKAQRKVLKKAYKKVKCRALWLWKLLFAVSLLCGAVLLAAKLLPAKILSVLPIMITAKLAEPVISLALWIGVGVMGLVLLGTVAGWCANAKRLKKTEEFLNYRTMCYALKAEKQLQK